MTFRLLLLFLASTLLVGCGWFGGDSKKSADDGGGKPPPEVTVAPPQKTDVTTYLTFIGQIEAVQRVEVRPQVGGYLREIHFEDGQEVKAGDLLFTIDQRPYQAAVNEAQASVDSRQASVKQAQESLDRNKRALERQAVSQIAVIDAQATLAEAKAAVESAQASLDTAKIDLDYATIASPIDGKISRRLVDVGNLLTAGQSTLMAVIVRTRPVYALFPVNERDFSKIRSTAEFGGPQATTVLVGVSRDAAGSQKAGETAGKTGNGNGNDAAAEADYAYRGRLTYLDPEIQTSTGTILMRATVDNEDGSLVAGQFIRVRVPTGTLKGALLVPQAALQSDQSGDYLYVVDGDDKVGQKHVTLGPRQDADRVVSDGLSPDDRVVIEGIQRVQPGAKVKTKQADSPTTKPNAESAKGRIPACEVRPFADSGSGFNGPAQGFVTHPEPSNHAGGSA